MGKNRKQRPAKKASGVLPGQVSDQDVNLVSDMSEDAVALAAALLTTRGVDQPDIDQTINLMLEECRVSDPPARMEVETPPAPVVNEGAQSVVPVTPEMEPPATPEIVILGDEMAVAQVIEVLETPSGRTEERPTLSTFVLPNQQPTPMTVGLPSDPPQGGSHEGTGGEGAGTTSMLEMFVEASLRNPTLLAAVQRQVRERKRLGKSGQPLAGKPVKKVAPPSSSLPGGAPGRAGGKSRSYAEVISTAGQKDPMLFKGTIPKKRQDLGVKGKGEKNPSPRPSRTEPKEKVPESAAKATARKGGNNPSRNPSRKDAHGLPERRVTVGGVSQARLCWNCRQPGHKFSNCPLPLIKMCKRCGARGKTVATCNTCKGRWEQEGPYVPRLGRNVPRDQLVTKPSAAAKRRERKRKLEAAMR